jgi:hypothetical protein
MLALWLKIKNPDVIHVLRKESTHSHYWTFSCNEKQNCTNYWHLKFVALSQTCLLLLLSRKRKTLWWSRLFATQLKLSNRLSTSLTNAAVDWHLLSMKPANNTETLKIPSKSEYYTTQIRETITPHNTTTNTFTFHSHSQCCCNYLLWPKHWKLLPHCCS